MKKPANEYSLDLRPLLRVYPTVFSFPRGKDEFRREQVQYMEMCYEGVTHGRDVVIEGPTGLGKTKALIASVTPMLLEDPKSRVVYATRTTAQVSNVMREIREILEGDKKGELSGIDASLYMGTRSVKEKVCDMYDEKSKGEEVCDNCPIKGKRFDEISEQEVEGFRVMDLDELDKLRKPEKPKIGYTDDDSDDGARCPVPYMKAKGKQSRILVCTSNYIFDDLWSDETVGDKSKTVLIVDEAHNFLEDASNTSNRPYITINTGERLSDVKEVDMNSRLNQKFAIHGIIEKARKFYGRDRDIQGIPKELSENDIYKLYLEDRFAGLFNHLVKLGGVLNEELSKYKIDKTLIPSPDEEEIDRFMIAEEDIHGFIEAVDRRIGDTNPFADSIYGFYRLVKGIKDRIEPRDVPIKFHMVNDCIYSMCDIVEAIKDVWERPYDYACRFDSKGNIQLYTLHPRNKANKAIRGFRSRIFTSATLSPPEDVAYLLGLEDALYAKIDPVFADANYCPFIIGGVNSGVKQDGEGRIITEKEEEILKTLLREALGAAKNRNVGVFCSSERVVEKMHEYITELKDELGVKVLTYISTKEKKNNGNNGEERPPLIDDFESLCNYLGMRAEFRSNPTSDNKIEVFKRMGKKRKRERYLETAVLVGVQGGSLSEGVDYPRKEMEMVITVGLPYPSSAAETALNNVKSDYFLFQRGDKELGIDLAYRQTALRKLAQSIGRANRGHKDRAVVICADERLMAIKNTKNDGSDRYEYLSSDNAKKNLKILQRPFWKFNKNLVFIGKDAAEEDALKRYIDYSRLSERDDFIGFGEMGERIREKFREWDRELMGSDEVTE